MSHYYTAFGRDKAIDNLIATVETASARYVSEHGLSLDAPRTYPAVRRPGWRWTKQGRYWLAFVTDAEGAVLAAVVFEGADLPRRV